MQSVASNEQEGFTYSGQLLFNGLYTTELKEGSQDNFDPAELKEQIDVHLPKLSDSTAVERRGFRPIGLDHALAEYDFDSENAKLSENIHKNLASQLLDREYIQEELRGETRVVTNDTQRVTGQELKERSAYLYWDVSSLLMVHGSKPDRQRLMRSVYQSLGINNDGKSNIISIKPVEFDPWFLLWLIYQDSQLGDIGNEMSIMRTQDIQLQSQAEKRDEFGNRAQVSGSINILQSVPVIAGLLRGMLPTNLEARFDLGGTYIDADISGSGRIHIRAEEDIRGASKLERVLIGIQFVQGLVRAQQDWESMDPDDRYVSPEFAETLYNNGKSQQVPVNFDKTLVRMQVEKRGESLSDWNHLDFS